MNNKWMNIKTQEKGMTLLTIIIIIIVLILLLLGGYWLINEKLNNNTNISNNNNNEELQSEKVEDIKKISNIDNIKEAKYPELFGKNKLFFTPPQSYRTRNFNINKNKQKNIVTKWIESRRDLQFKYIVDENNIISVTIGTYTNLIYNVENFLNKETTHKETINNIDLYSEKENFGSDQIKSFYVFINGDDIRYTIEIEGKYQLIKKHFTEIMDAIEYDRTDSKKIESTDLLKSKIGDYTFDFSQNAYAYDWYINKPERYNTMIYIKYYVPTSNEDSYGAKITYDVGMYVYNKLDTFEIIKSRKESEDELFGTTTEFIKLPIDGYNFYVSKETYGNSTKYLTVYLLIDEQVIEFGLSHRDYNYSNSNITNENMVVDMINKQIINQILFR